MQLLGEKFEEIRSRPGKRPFSRGTNQEEYKNALAQLEPKVSIKDLAKAGEAATDGDNFKCLSRGSMFLIASADALLMKYEGSSELTEPIAADLLDAAKYFHFAANTLRRLDQFELSADFYWISARVGLAVAKSHITTRQHYRELLASDKKTKLLEQLMEWSDRSFMRAGAVMKETGSDERRRRIFKEHRDLRRLWSWLKFSRRDLKSLFNWSILCLWRAFSVYGTSLSRLLLLFPVYVFVAALVQFAGFAEQKSFSEFGLLLLDTFNVSTRGQRSVISPNAAFAYIDAALRSFGIIWILLIGQALIQRISFRS